MDPTFWSWLWQQMASRSGAFAGGFPGMLPSSVMSWTVDTQIAFLKAQHEFLKGMLDGPFDQTMDGMEKAAKELTQIGRQQQKELLKTQVKAIEEYLARLHTMRTEPDATGK